MTTRARSAIGCVLLAGLLVLARAHGFQSADDDRPLLSGVHDGPSLTAAVRDRLDRGARNLAAMQAAGTPPVRILELFDEAQRDLETADTLTSFVARVSSDALIRAAAQQSAQTVSTFANDLAVNRDVYDVLSRIDPRALDADTRYFLSRTLATYRAAGVGLDRPAREAVSALRTKIDELNRRFTANIEAGTRTLRVPPADLAGLPEEFVKRHPPAPDGLVDLTTAAADSGPVLSSASSAALRRAMFVAVNNVGYPANDDVLASLRAARLDLAQRLGFRSWAEYDVSDRMAATGRGVEAFLDAVDAGSRGPAEREYGILLDRKRRGDPQAQAVDAWDADYYTDLVRRDRAPGAGSFRLPYDAVESGILRIAGQLFDLTFAPAPVPVWDASVKAFEIRQANQPVGRVYLDVYVRPNKRNRGAGTVALRSGGGRQLPEVALIAGFGGEPGKPASLTQAEIRTFFHEFGHVVHFVVGGRHRWSGLDSIHAERDFLEAPSQMLEAWMLSPATLALLAGPAGSLDPQAVDQLRAAQRSAEFGEALRERYLLFRSRLAWKLHGTTASEPADRLATNAYTSSLPYAYLPDTHHYAGFTHLANPNYTSGYYTYLWSLVVAKDLEGQFDHADLMAAAPAKRYRVNVLEVGAAKPASQILRDFLGREFSTSAWQGWIRSIR